MVDPYLATLLSAVLFSLGILGVLVNRDTISTLLSLELMLCAAILALVSFDHMFSRATGAADVVSGQGFGLLVLTLATAQATVGLGLAIAVRRNRVSPEREEIGAAKW